MFFKITKSKIGIDRLIDKKSDDGPEEKYNNTRKKEHRDISWFLFLKKNSEVK